MSKEIQKPNDMLVSTIINGNVDTMDLLKGGINAGNTQFLDPEYYKETKFIKEKFTDEDGNFREDIFNLAYLEAYKSYQDLTEMNTYLKLEKYVEYNAKDIFAPLTSKKATIGYEISPEKNPMRKSHGVKSLFEDGDQQWSMRELAQMSKIWDTEKGQWMDKTAQDRGVLGSLFGQSLVYATYDEDTEEVDPITGRKIKHKKGDWKLNEDGQYYTETIGNRQSYGKQFVAASDTLTKEGSALNKIDFFDSDDLEKSAVGTVMKTVTKIVPYLIPEFNVVWGGATAALEMAKVLPTFIKMAEGIVVGGDDKNETALTRTMNSWENYFGKFEKSYSDAGMQSNWGAEKMLDQVSDIFAQLYQMRAAASLSKLAVKDPTRKAIKEFSDKYTPELLRTAANPASGLNLMDEGTKDKIIKTAILKMPSMKEALKAQTKLSKALSTGYMALSSSADVYSDALASGYDRRMAGFAGIAAALGLYGIMMAENTLNLGGWFLDEKVGYHEGVLRATMMKALREEYDKIGAAVDKLAESGTKAEKASIIQKALGAIMPKLKKAKLSIKDGGLYLRNGVIEAIEEVTEEAVMDATKGIFDFLSWAGVGSNPNASFGVVEDFTSGNFIERYLQNAVGGFMGGVLFEFLLNKIEPWMKHVLMGKALPEDVKTSIIHEIANGHTQDLYKALDEMAELDSDVSINTINIDGTTVNTTATNGPTRGLTIAKVLKQYIQTLEGVLIDENANLTDDQILKKSMRDIVAVKMLEQFGTDKLLISDFTKLATEITDIKALINQKQSDEADKKLTEELKKALKEEEEKAKEDVKDFGDRTDWQGKSDAFLKELLNQKRQELLKFLKGEKAEDYLYKTLVLSTPEIRNAIGGISKYDYAYLKYGVDYKSLTDKGTLTKQQLDSEYETWNKTADINQKLISFGAEAYKDFDKRFSQFIIDYNKKGYADVRQVVFKELLSSGNLTLNDYIDDNANYEHLKLIANHLKGQEGNNTEKTGNLVLDDIFTQDELLLKDEVKQIFDNNPDALKLLESLGQDRKTIETSITNILASELGQLNIDNLSGETLSSLVKGYIHQIIKESLDKLVPTLQDLTLKGVNDYLISKGIALNPVDETIGAHTDNIAISDYLTSQITLSNLDKISVGLGTSLLNKYLLNNDVIDGEVKRRISYEALLSILLSIANNSDEIRKTLNSIINLEHIVLPEEIHFDVLLSDIGDLVNLLNDKFDSGESIDDILKQWGTDLAVKFFKKNEDTDFTEYYQLMGLAPQDISVENIAKEITKSIKPYITENKLYKLYLQAKTKEIRENSIYDSLGKIATVLTESGEFKVLDILKQQHELLRSAVRFEDYLPQQETEFLLESSLRALLLYKALLLGMRGDEVSLGSPFAINLQMKRFLEQNKISSERTYETIDSKIANLILNDLSIKEQEIKGYLQFKERAYINKTGQDAIIKKSYCEKMIDRINELAVAFALDDNGFSILPRDDERLKETPEETLAFLLHELFTRFHSHFKSAKSKGEAILRLIKLLNFSPDVISRSSRPTNLSTEIKAISDYDILLFLATSLGADSHDFYYRYNEKILNNKESKIVPFFSQEMAALQAWSFARDNNLVEIDEVKSTLHAAIIKEFFKNNNEISAIPAEQMFFINGITGAGKSTVVGAILSVLLADLKQYISAPNQQLIDNYIRMIEKYHTPKEELEHGNIYNIFVKIFGRDAGTKIYSQCKEIKKVGPGKFYELFGESSLFELKTKKNGDIFQVLREEEIAKYLQKEIDLGELPELIFIDEATQIGQPVLLVLNYLAKIYGIKFILSGDSVQRGAYFDGDSQAFNDLFMFKSAKLNISIRSDNNQVSSNNVEFNKLLEIYEEDLIASPSHASKLFAQKLTNPDNNIRLAYYQDENTFNGYKFVDSLKNYTEDIKLIAKLNELTESKQPVMVITELDGNGNPTNTDLVALIKDCGLTNVKYYSPSDTHSKSVQGSEAEYVIVDYNCFKNPYPENNENDDPVTFATKHPGEMLRSVYTFASRAKKGALVALPVQIQSIIGIRNAADRYTQKDEIPQLAKIELLKEKRLEEMKKILGDWKPEKLALDSLEVVEKDGKKYYRRKGSKEGKLSVTASTESKKATVNNEPIDHNAEASFSEEEQQKILEMTQEEPELDQGDADPTGTPNRGFTPKSTSGTNTDSVAMWAAMDTINVDEKEGSNGLYVPVDNGINFNMDGLFDQKRIIYPHQKRGMLYFKHLLAAAKNKEDVVQGIKSNRYIALFLAEACPKVAFSQNVTSWENIWRDSDILCDIYSKWFRDKVGFDDDINADGNYYVFGKSLQWDPDNNIFTDKPVDVANSNIERSVGTGNTALYYGVHLKSEDGLLNLYISLGLLSKLTMPDGTRLQSDELAKLYDQADLALGKIEDPKKKFVAYKLTKSKMFDMNMSSTMWLRRIEGRPIEETFLSIADMRKRGFEFDTNNMYYVDDDMVYIKGEYHYKMLVLMAKMGVTAADINQRFEEKKFTFEERLKILEDTYVDKQTKKLKIKGSYWTIAKYFNTENLGNSEINSKAYNRIIFLNGRKVDAATVFNGLKFDSKLTKVEDFDVRRKLSTCSPASLTKLIVEMLALIKAFEDPSVLLKYLIGWKNSFNKVMGNLFAHDRETLDKLIDIVKTAISENKTVSSTEFRNHLLTLKHRALLFPFFIKFVIPDGNQFRIVDARKFLIVNGLNDVPVLDLGKNRQEGSLQLNMDQLSMSVPYPVFAKTDKVDIKSEFNLDFSEESGQDLDFKMYQINFNEDKLANNIGIYGYQLLAPTFQIKNSILGSVQTDSDGNFVAENPLELLTPRKEIDQETGEEYWVDPRFPDRRSHEELPQKPLEFNPDNWHPVPLTSDDFYEDTTFSKFILEKKTEGEGKGKYTRFRKNSIYDPKTKTYVKWDRKLHKVVYYNTKEKKWKPSKMEWAEFSKLKNSKSNPKEWDYKYRLKNAQGKRIVLSVENDQGFEIRPGDYVLINGDTSMSFYVAGIKRDDGLVKAMISHYSYNGKGERVEVMNKFDKQMLCPISDITAVVKRTVPKKDLVYMKNDVYITGKFNKPNKYNSGDYTKLFKTSDMMIELAEAANQGSFILSLDFKLFSYIAVAINEGEESNFEVLYDPLRSSELGPNHSRILMPIETPQLLLDYIETLKNQAGVSGLTLFNIKKLLNLTLTQLLNQKGFIQHVREEISSGKLGYIAHEVLFDESLVSQNNSLTKQASVLEVEYIVSDIIEKISQPAEIVQLMPDGNLDLSAMAKFELKPVTLSEREFTAAGNQANKYKDSEWIHIRRVDTKGDVWYDMIPAPLFYFGTNAPTELSSRFNTIMNHGFIAPLTKLQFWELNLKSLVVIDRQSEAYDPVKKQENGKPREKKDIDAEQEKKDKQKSILELNNPKHRKIVITSVQYDSKSKEIILSYIPEGNYGTVYDPRIIKQISLKEFLASIGARFKITTERKLEITLQPASLKNLLEETKPEETKPEETKPEETKPEETKPEGNPSNFIITSEGDIANYVNNINLNLSSTDKLILIDKLQNLYHNFILELNKLIQNPIIVNNALLDGLINVLNSSTGSQFYNLLNSVIKTSPNDAFNAIIILNYAISNNLDINKIINKINSEFANEIIDFETNSYLASYLDFNKITLIKC